ncbi:sodium:calcium antiporter [Candidatus Woesebacteria bacterium]|nr:sodium:calcium antiporter [Candidatus Woesebacteria bacterium]
MLSQLALFIHSCFTIWVGAGMVIKVVSSVAHSLKVSPFTMSFFVLGLMTSLPEFVIGVTAVYRGEADLMVGNLIGATLVLFLLVIPLLAITGRGVNLPKDLSRRNMLLSLLTIIAPAIMIVDRQLSLFEGIFLVVLYLALFIMLGREANLFQQFIKKIKTKTIHHSHRLLKLVLGLGLIFISSQQIVSSAEYFATALNWSPFIVGLLLLSIGTNIPELSLVLRSVVGKQQDIALADYVGSAAGNTLLIGIFTIGNMGSILLPNHATQRIILTVVSLILFYLFARSRKVLSRKEGFVLLALYVIFVVLELMSVK